MSDMSYKFGGSSPFDRKGTIQMILNAREILSSRNWEPEDVPDQYQESFWPFVERMSGLDEKTLNTMTDRQLAELMTELRLWVIQLTPPRDTGRDM